MKLCPIERQIDIDFGSMRLADVREALDRENFYADRLELSLHQQVDEQHLIFVIHPHQRSSPIQLHEYRYDAEQKRLTLKSYFSGWFSKLFAFYQFPLLILILNWPDLSQFQWLLIGGSTLLITILIPPFHFLMLKSDMQELERELSIRLPHIARQRNRRG